MASLIKPRTIQVKDSSGAEKEFIISKMPAMIGREVLAKYPISNIPKIGEYQASADAMMKLMSCVAVNIEGREEPLRLTTADLINNHVSDGEQLLRLEIAMLQENLSFFGQGGKSISFTKIIEKYVPKIMKTVMDSLPPSLARDLQAGLNLKQK